MPYVLIFILIRLTEREVQFPFMALLISGKNLRTDVFTLVISIISVSVLLCFQLLVRFVKLIIDFNTVGARAIGLDRVGYD